MHGFPLINLILSINLKTVASSLSHCHPNYEPAGVDCTHVVKIIYCIRGSTFKVCQPTIEIKLDKPALRWEQHQWKLFD